MHWIERAWKEYNVLMVSAIIQKRAFPLFWTLLDKQGASNLAEQQQVLRPVIRLLKRYKLIIIGAREWNSIELAQWLHRQQFSLVLRQKSSTTFREKRQPFQALDSIPVQPGIYLFYPKVGFTKKKGFSRFNLVASGQRKYRGKEEDEPWYLLTNLPDLKSALEVYSKRYGIEAMFKDCKTGGYNARGLSSITGAINCFNNFNCPSHDFGVVARKKNPASGTRKICLSASRNG